jgi:hypothetical protein
MVHLACSCGQIIITQANGRITRCPKCGTGTSLSLECRRWVWNEEDRMWEPAETLCTDCGAALLVGQAASLDGDDDLPLCPGCRANRGEP